MMVNLPNDIIADALARKLMSLFIAKDPKSGTKIMLCEMETDFNTGMINTKYYPITGNETWLSIFEDERDNAIRVSRDTIVKLKSNKASNTDLMNYSKIISQISMFTSVTMSTSKSFKAPDFNTMLKETKEASKKEVNKKKEEEKKEGS